MKKVFAVCLALVMMASMSITAFASNGGFVSSPSANQAPELTSYKNESSDCVARIVLNSYSSSNLTGDARVQMDKAYNTIVASSDLSKLNTGLTDIAKKQNVKVSDLAVKDLFDVSHTECAGHDNHGTFTIELAPETLNNYVCLMRYSNNKWDIVSGAKITSDGKHLQFTTDVFGPFAIVVKTTNSGSESPETGDNGIVALLAVLMSASMLGICVVSRRIKKHSV